VKRHVSGIAAAVAAVAVSVTMFGGAAQADDPEYRDGAPGRPGTGTATCRYLPPPQDDFVQCTSSGGQGGAGGSSVDY
jgi:hypothetical protein